MKKILLCTTALAGLVAGSAFAEELQTTFAGSIKSEAGYRKISSQYKDSFPLTPNQNSSAFSSSAKANLKVEGKTDSMVYGAVVRLQVVTKQGNGPSTDGRLDRSHIYMDMDAGSVQLGTNIAASRLLSVDASTIASASGGIDGDFSDFINLSTSSDDTYSNNKANLFTSSMFTGTQTLTNMYDGSKESAYKITYLSPRISGAQFGVSYIPDLSNGGNNFNSDHPASSNNNPSYYIPNGLKVKNLWSLGLNYTNMFNDVSFAFSVVGDFGKTSNKNNEDALGNAYTSNSVKTYSIGTVVGKDGFSFAASYSNNGKSGLPKGNYALATSEVEGVAVTTPINFSSFKSNFYTLGLAYENGPMSTSLTYLSGKAGNSAGKMKSSIISLGADYEVAPGFKPFAEVTMAQYKPTGSVQDLIGTNAKLKATVLIVGTKLKF